MRFGIPASGCTRLQVDVDPDVRQNVIGRICAQTTDNTVCTAPAGQMVIAPPANQNIVAAPAIQRVVELVAFEQNLDNIAVGAVANDAMPSAGRVVLEPAAIV